MNWYVELFGALVFGAAFGLNSYFTSLWRKHKKRKQQQQHHFVQNEGKKK